MRCRYCCRNYHFILGPYLILLARMYMYNIIRAPFKPSPGNHDLYVRACKYWGRNQPHPAFAAWFVDSRLVRVPVSTVRTLIFDGYNVTLRKLSAHAQQYALADELFLTHPSYKVRHRCHLISKNWTTENGRWYRLNKANEHQCAKGFIVCFDVTVNSNQRGTQ